jgi:membrane fusion protein, multidrug efflux system
MAASDALKKDETKVSPGAPRGSEGAPRHGRGWIWAIIFLLLVGGAIYFYRAKARGQAAAAAKQTGPPTISVSVTPVRTHDVPYYITGLGSVTAFNTVTVKSRVDGQLMKVNFKEGQFVHEGDVLAEIDPRPFQVALDQAQGQLAKDVASQLDAKIDLNRYQQLWQEGVVARQQLDTQQAMVGQFDGSIQADKAQIDNQKLQLTYCKITAPIGGRVGLRLVDAGNIVHAADANGMLVITQVQPISVIFTLPEDNLPQVTAEMRNKQLAVEGYSRDDKTKLADGKLLTIDNQIDPTTGTVKLKSVFDNKDLSLWPNQFVNIRLFLTTRKDATVIPASAIQRGTQGSFVYVVKPDNTAEARPIQEDFIEGNIAVIKQGLAAGEQVVIDGQDKLQAGAKVTARPATPARAPQSGSASGGQNQ